MHRFQHTAMATQFEIRCDHRDAEYARQAARAAFAAVDSLEHKLSRFVENSDITRVNHLEAGESTVVGFETMQCLQLAVLLHAETRGAFDISLGTGFDQLELAPADFLVSANAPGVRLDLGAIGKGYAVDRMADVLEDWDVRQALIDAGFSSVLALDPPSGTEGWPLTLSDPGPAGVVRERLCARQLALAASGIRKGDHIVNPRDGAPIRSRAAAWVAAPRGVLASIGRQAGVDDAAAAVADALSTACMVLPEADIAGLCDRHHAMEAWILEGTLSHFPATARQHNE